jgi:hypothetical protein
VAEPSHTGLATTPGLRFYISAADADTISALSFSTISIAGRATLGYNPRSLILGL